MPCTYLYTIQLDCYFRKSFCFKPFCLHIVKACDFDLEKKQNLMNAIEKLKCLVD